MQEGASHLEEEFIKDERPCLFCGYSVRGLPARGKCPECGGSIAESCRTVLLLRASDARLRRIAKALSLVNRLVLSAVVLLLSAISIALCYSLLTGDDRPADILFLIGAILAAVLLLAAAANWFRLTSPFPERDGVLPFARASRLLLGGILGTFTLSGGLATFGVHDGAVGWLFAAFAVLLPAWMVSVALVLRQLAVRLADYWGWKRLPWAIGAAVLSLPPALYLAWLSLTPWYYEVMTALSIPVTMIGVTTGAVWAAIAGDALGKGARELRRIERYRSQLNSADAATG